MSVEIHFEITIYLKTTSKHSHWQYKSDRFVIVLFHSKEKKGEKTFLTEMI